MLNTRRNFVSLVLAAAVTMTAANVCFAEASSSERSVTGFFRRLFNYPVKAVQKTGEMTGNTLTNTGEKVISKTGENTAAIVKGDLAKTGDLVGDNVSGSLNTAGQTASETVQVPVKAAEEDNS